MRRVALVIHLFSALTLAFWLTGATSLSAFAQDEGTPPAGGETTEQEALQGTLTIFVFTCTDGPEGVAGALVPEGAFTPSEQCVEEGTAAIAIDGGAAEAIVSGTQYTLDEGIHTVAEETLGASLDVSVSAQAPVSIYAVFYAAPQPEEAAVPGTVMVMKHLCPAEIQTREDFDALGDFVTKLQTCPVITLPGDEGPDGAVSGNDPDQPLSFDFQVAFGDSTLAITSATFVPDQICEADLGDINGDPTDNVCLDTSHYVYADVIQGPVTVTEIAPPDGYLFGTLEFTPESGDEATLVETVAGEGRIELDTSGDESVMLHIYNFQEPVENRVNVVKHLCPAEIDAEGFVALGGYLEKIVACPVVLRGDDSGPEGAITGGHRTFAFEVEGSDGVTQTLEDNATFMPDQICEDEIGDVNGDPNDNICLDASRYQFDGVIQGAGVLISETRSPSGYAFGGVEFDPESGDAATLVAASDDGVIELDTTSDGEVTLHVFNVASTDPEPEPTNEPSLTGTLQVVKLFCYGPVEETVITALTPGEEASADQLGDGSCVAGNADFALSLFGVEEQRIFEVGDDGVEAIDELPVTDSETGPHLLTEMYSGVTGGFDIQAETTTRVIVLNYVLEEAVQDDPTDETLDDEVADGDEEAVGEAVSDIDDEETIQSGEDLAETGAGPIGRPADPGMVLLLAAVSLLILAGGTLTRRRPA